VLAVTEELPDSVPLGHEVREELWDGDEVIVTDDVMLTVM
jgi:hypothetical protein